MGGDSLQLARRDDRERDGYFHCHLGRNSWTGAVRGKLSQGKRFPCSTLCQLHVSSLTLPRSADRGEKRNQGNPPRTRRTNQPGGGNRSPWFVDNRFRPWSIMDE